MVLGIINPVSAIQFQIGDNHYYPRTIDEDNSIDTAFQIADNTSYIGDVNSSDDPSDFYKIVRSLAPTICPDTLVPKTL